MTIDQLMEFLKSARESSPLKGDTVAYVCIPELEYRDIQTVAFITDGDIGGTISIGINEIPDGPCCLAGSPTFYEYEGGAYR